MKNKFDYQDKIAKEVINSLSFNYKAIILGLSPNSGKTITSHKIINLLPNKKILVVTHGQNLLKNQYLDELTNSKIKLNFSFGVLNSNTDVEVCIFQEYKNINKPYDVVIIDEGHHFYGSEMCTSLLEKAKPKNIIIMTGTPSKFTKENKEKVYKIIYLSVQELERKDIYSKLSTDFIKINSDDMGHKMMALKSKVDKMKNDKILIACPNIKYAEMVSKVLVNRKVGVSTSSDKNNVIIDKYKNGEIDTLIVVNKGVLGFNDAKTSAVIDLKCSDNLDTTYQLLARVLRKDGDKEKKYIRMVDKKEMSEYYQFIAKIKDLFKKRSFQSFGG